MKYAHLIIFSSGIVEFDLEIYFCDTLNQTYSDWGILDVIVFVIENCWSKFKSWTRGFVFPFELVTFRKVWNHLFSHQLWVNSSEIEFSSLGKVTSRGIRKTLYSNPPYFT